ncbi:MAG: ABC transporter ATP-binding protein [Lachnospiraceae bacterium]|nr:ABC transporter ATP-binding protein [Lachnospiraceae bacterium]
MKDDSFAIQISHVDKVYKLFSRRRDRLIDAFSLSKTPHYKESYALRDVSFDVKKGETIGIIGTNGSGKSTILKIITGVLKQTRGDVKIDGRISALLELGAGFNLEYTGIENVYLNGTMIGFSKEEIDEKLDSILSFADIGDFVHQPVKTYSSGMFVRLAFAVAINIDPEILIVDEALSVGDVFFQNKCFKKFDEFKSQGKTILIVSHDLSSIRKYCDRVILLNRGVKIAEGDPTGMLDLYKKIIVTGNGEGITSVEDIIRLSENMNSPSGSSQRTIADEKKELLSGHASAGNISDGGPWKTHFAVNPDLNPYGTLEAEIIDFAVLDKNGEFTTTLFKGEDFQIKSKVLFHSEIEDPIFTFTIKTLKGMDVTGTNTFVEKKSIGTAEAGDVYVCTFTQEMNLQGGEYLLSISCTGYDEKGELHAYNRLYDLLSITVISEKNTVGFYDMNSKVEIEKTDG